MKQTHAPGWRGRAQRTGPINDETDLPRWILFLEAIAPTGCVIIAGFTLALVFYAFGVDFLAGHL